MGPYILQGSCSLGFMLSSPHFLKLEGIGRVAHGIDVCLSTCEKPKPSRNPKP